MALTAQADPAAPAAARDKNITRLVVATSLGNALEWFDISVYAYFAVYLSKAFFPTSDPTTSLLLTFGTFALTFLARPIGGILLGTYADRYGRKASLLLSIAMMTLGTLAGYTPPQVAACLQRVVVHELGHVFGAEHVEDTTSLMNENFGYRTEFDARNRAVIRKNRSCPFAK